jgi:hypothetical protein
MMHKLRLIQQPVGTRYVHLGAYAPRAVVGHRLLCFHLHLSLPTNHFLLPPVPVPILSCALSMSTLSLFKYRLPIHDPHVAPAPSAARLHISRLVDATERRLRLVLLAQYALELLHLLHVLTLPRLLTETPLVQLALALGDGSFVARDGLCVVPEAAVDAIVEGPAESFASALGMLVWVCVRGAM